MAGKQLVEVVAGRVTDGHPTSLRSQPAAAGGRAPGGRHARRRYRRSRGHRGRTWRDTRRQCQPEPRGSASAKVTSRSTPLARIRPAPLAKARRYQGVVRPLDGADIDIISRSHDPHRHVGTETAVPAAGGELELLGIADTLQLIAGPGRHPGLLCHNDPIPDQQT
jgi:hypothetical protein